MQKTSVRYLLRLGAPLVAASIVAFGIHTTDAVMAGWYGVETLAGLTIAGTVWYLVFMLGSGFGFALTPLIAAAHQSDDPVRLRRVARMALWLSFAFGALCVLALWQMQALMLWIGQDPVVAAAAQDYMRIALWGMGFALAGHCLRVILGVFELTMAQFWISFAALFANMVLNYALIFGRFGAPEMGIRGAALGSVIIEVLQALALALYLARKRDDLRLWIRLWRPDWGALAQVARLGLPIGITALAETGLFAASAVMVGWLGPVPLAAHGIALQATALSFMFHVGMAQAATIAASHAAGADQAIQFRAVTKSASTIALAFASLVMVCFFLFGRSLIGVFLAPGDPAFAQIVLIGVVLLKVAALFQYVDAAQIVAMSLLRAKQDTSLPMLIATISYWAMGIPASYLFGIIWDMGARGIWLGLAFGLACAALALWLRLWLRFLRAARST